MAEELSPLSQMYPSKRAYFAALQVAAELKIKRSVAYDLGLRIQREFAEANATAQEWDPKDMVDRPGISSMRLSE
eukprot:2463386-Pleurochrysis_carterae.AAC.1